MTVSGTPEGLGLHPTFLQGLKQRLHPERRELQALVLVPTAKQARVVVRQLEKSDGQAVRALTVEGGAGLENESRKIREGAHALVGTPSVLVDHLYRGSLSTDTVRVVALESPEAMFRSGQLEDAETLCSCLLSVREGLVFAAPLPQEVEQIIQRILKDPVRISTEAATASALVGSVAPAPAAPAAVAAPASPAPAKVAPRHQAQSLSAPRKGPFLCEFLKDEKPAQPIVFCSSRQSVDSVVERLGREGLTAPVVLDTEAAEQDLSQITHLINFSVPRTAESYLQRVENSPRAVIVLTLISPNEKSRFEEIVTESGIQLSQAGEAPAAPVPVQAAVEPVASAPEPVIESVAAAVAIEEPVAAAPELVEVDQEVEVAQEVEVEAESTAVEPMSDPEEESVSPASEASSEEPGDWDARQGAEGGRRETTGDFAQDDLDPDSPRRRRRRRRRGERERYRDDFSPSSRFPERESASLQERTEVESPARGQNRDRNRRDQDEEYFSDLRVSRPLHEDEESYPPRDPDEVIDYRWRERSGNSNDRSRSHRRDPDLRKEETPRRDEGNRRDETLRRDEAPRRVEGNRRDETARRDEGTRRDEGNRRDEGFRQEGTRRDEGNRRGESSRRDDRYRRDEESRRDDAPRRESGFRKDDAGRRDEGYRREDSSRADGNRRDEQPRSDSYRREDDYRREESPRSDGNRRDDDYRREVAVRDEDEPQDEIDVTPDDDQDQDEESWGKETTRREDGYRSSRDEKPRRETSYRRGRDEGARSESSRHDEDSRSESYRRDEGARRDEAARRDEGPRREDASRRDDAYRNRDENRRDEGRREESRRDENRRDEGYRSRDEGRRDEASRYEDGPRRTEGARREENSRRDDTRREDGSRRRRERSSTGRNDSFRGEPNFNRKGIAPEPPPQNTGSGGLLVGENRDRWKLTDRRGRPVKRPWLSEDDRNQRLFGNQLPPDSNRDSRRSYVERSGLPSTEGNRNRSRQRSDRDQRTSQRNDDSGDLSGRRRRRRRRPSGQDGGSWNG